jgi:hypothetical protein
MDKADKRLEEINLTNSPEFVVRMVQEQIADNDGSYSVNNFLRSDALVNAIHLLGLEGGDVWLCLLKDNIDIVQLGSVKPYIEHCCITRNFDKVKCYQELTVIASTLSHTIQFTTTQSRKQLYKKVLLQYMAYRHTLNIAYETDKIAEYHLKVLDLSPDYRSKRLS